MNRSAAILLIGIPLGALVYLALRRSPQRARKAQLHIDSRDLQYQDLSPDDLMSQNLTDINEAGAAALRELGLDQQSSERLIENRPYRNKLDLVSRCIGKSKIYFSHRKRIGGLGKT